MPGKEKPKQEKQEKAQPQEQARPQKGPQGKARFGKAKQEKGQEEAQGAQRPKRELVGIVRVMETDLPGNRKVRDAIRLIPGISFSIGSAISKFCPFADKEVGEISEQEIKHLEEMVQNPGRHGIPSWAFNRRKDMLTGQDLHVLASKLEITNRMDIDQLKKIRCYRGVRHMQGLPVRGQRTRSSFRKSGKTVGVSRSKAARTKQKKENE